MDHELRMLEIITTGASYRPTTEIGFLSGADPPWQRTLRDIAQTQAYTLEKKIFKQRKRKEEGKKNKYEMTLVSLSCARESGLSVQLNERKIKIGRDLADYLSYWQPFISRRGGRQPPSPPAKP